MIRLPAIDPDIIRLGPVHIRWYGLMYVLGFLSAYLLIARQPRARRMGLSGERLQNLVFSLVVGLVAGARLGYILFYQFTDIRFYLVHPLEIIAVWHGGMSFHGGLVGALIAGLLFCRKHGLSLWELGDTVIVTAPIGLGLGRIGNFINGELFGRPASVPWAMVFPGGGPLPRHPSQLYEAALEGLVLFFILWRAKDRPARPGAMICLFLLLYGVFRFFVEFFRQPDPQVGLFLGIFSMGQILSCAMIIGAGILWWLLPKPSPGYRQGKNA